MIIGLTIWGQRISPVFDSAQKLLVVDVQNSKIISRRSEVFEPALPLLLSKKLEELEIEVLICGAISKSPADVIESVGIKCIPFISGNVDNILYAYIKGETLTTKFIMPGCGRNRGLGGCKNGAGIGRGHGRGCGRDAIR